ncbi:MAG: hypothetical protein M3Q58_13175 [Bacteroidota bacterium]|nr:hypothetical protein [Bacteroidota bacterium]
MNEEQNIVEGFTESNIEIKEQNLNSAPRETQQERDKRYDEQRERDRKFNQGVKEREEQWKKEVREREYKREQEERK